LKFITKQLKKNLPIHHKLLSCEIIDPKKIKESINKIKNHKTIIIYDLTTTKQQKHLKKIPVNDHINRTGKNPLINKQDFLNIDFLDIGSSYVKKEKGIITNCCGEQLKSQHLYPSHFLCNIIILAKALKIQECHAYLINII